MNEKLEASIKTLARYEPDIVYIGTGEYVAECVRADDGDYYLAADADAAIEALQAEIERLREQLRLATVDQAIAEAEASDAHAENERLLAEVERLRADLMESDEIREKLGHLLTRTAAALKGEPPEGVWHSWHDLPERAERLKEALEDIRSRLANLPTHPDDPWEFTAICRVADAALAKENNND